MIEGGSINGFGSIQTDVTNDGEINHGEKGTLLNIKGNYQQSGQFTVHISGRKVSCRNIIFHQGVTLQNKLTGRLSIYSTQYRRWCFYRRRGLFSWSGRQLLKLLTIHFIEERTVSLRWWGLRERHQVRCLELQKAGGQVQIWKCKRLHIVH